LDIPASSNAKAVKVKFILEGRDKQGRGCRGGERGNPLLNKSRAKEKVKAETGGGSGYPAGFEEKRRRPQRKK